MATAKLESIKNLDGKRFFVPSYQRGYRWEETQIKELLDDLYEFAQKHAQMASEDKENAYYCLQPIVVKKRDDDTWEVIDGQQRLTAIWFLRQVISILENSAISKTVYSLDYEKKEKFSNIFRSIESLSDRYNDDEITYRKFVKAFAEDNIMLNGKVADTIYKQMQECIDGRYVHNTFEHIINYRCKDEIIEKKLEILRKHFTLANSINDIITKDKVKVIWYEVETEDAIKTFLNLNANKIELTNAELLKAKLFCGVNNEKRQMLALQWEEIERGLHDKKFWNFIASNEYVSGKYKDATKIDYLFEIYIASDTNENVVKESDRYRIFRRIDTELSSSSKAVDALWREILKIYETLHDWYDDYFFYHTIGLLINFQTINKIKELYTLYMSSTKIEFEKIILEHIKKIFTRKNYFESIKRIDIESRLNDYKYGENDTEIKEVLFLYNIATLVNAQNGYERFPFELYKINKWDIEHIIPLHPDENSSKDDKIRWVNDNYYLEDDKIDEETPDLYFTEIDLNEFGNLTLLDVSTNRSYKNKSFSQKRDTIIKIIKNEYNGDGEKYLCVGTKWVFLKGHLSEGLADKGRLNFWTQDDTKAYISDVTDRIYNFFNILDKVRLEHGN